MVIAGCWQANLWALSWMLDFLWFRKFLIAFGLLPIYAWLIANFNQSTKNNCCQWIQWTKNNCCYCGQMPIKYLNMHGWPMLVVQCPYAPSNVLISVKTWRVICRACLWKILIHWNWVTILLEMKTTKFTTFVIVGNFLLGGAICKELALNWGRDM